MNRAATLTLNAPLLMLVAALALSTPFTAGAAPAFLDYAQQQTQQSQAQEKTTPQAQNKHKKAARAQIIKNRYQHLTITKKNRQPAGGDCTKDKLIQQLKKQLAATPQTDTAGANEQAALNKRINELQVALSAATAEKEALIKKQALCRIIIYSKARPRRVSRSSN